MTTIRVYGDPAPQGSKNAYRRGGKVLLVEANKALKPWRDSVTLHARRYTGAHTGNKPLSVRYVFYLPRPKSVRRPHPHVKPDLDKLIRAVNDGISAAGVWDDDSRPVTMTATKRYADEANPPGCLIRIEEINK